MIDAAAPSGSVDKALDVLFHLHSQSGATGVSAVGRALGMPRSSAHRLLQALGRRGLVEQDERGRYRLGVALVALGLGALEREPIVVAARPIIEALAAELDETVFVTAARAGAITVLDKAEGTGFLRAAPRVGSEIPVHATAVGKLYLAFAPERLRRADAPGEVFTPGTRSDPAELAAEVDAVRRRGSAQNRDEWIQGLSVVAAPVFMAGGLRGALAVAVPSAHWREPAAADLHTRVSAAAAEVGQRLGGHAS